MSKTITLTILLLFFSFLSSGCSSFFMSENQPKTLEKKPNTLINQKDESSSTEIKGFVNLTPGIVTDLSSNGNKIVGLKSEVSSDSMDSAQTRSSNNLFLYNIRKNESESVISNQINKSLGQFDSREKGIYYLENKDESTSQLFWIDDSGNKKVKISSSEHTVSPNFHVTSGNELFYGTKEGKILHADKTGILSTIDLGIEYSIEQVYYYRKKNLIVFSATKDKHLNLYSIDPNGQKPTLIIPKILGDFDISTQEDRLLYISPIPDSNKSDLLLLQLDNMQKVKLMDGYPRRASFSPNGKKILYLDKIDSNDDHQSIWVINIKNDERKQIASNLKIADKVFWHPDDEKIFFSTYQTIENKVQFTIHSLDFSE